MNIYSKIKYLLILIFILTFNFTRAQSVWNRYYTFNLDNWASSIDILSDGNIFISGRESNVSGQGNYFVSKLDSNGNESWHFLSTHFAGFTGDNSGYDIVGLPDGGSLLGGGLQMPTNIYNLYFARFDSSGNLLWEKNYGNNYDQILTSILPFNNNFYATVGSLSSPPENYLFKFNSSGDSISSIRLFYAISSNPSSFIKYNDSTLVLACKSLDTLSGIQNLTICKLDTFGNVFEDHIYSDSISFEPGAINISPDNGFVFTGYSNAHAISKLLKVDYLGSVEWEKRFNNMNNCLCSVLSNGDVLFSLGSSDSIIVILRYSSIGTLISSDTIQQSYLQSELFDNSTDLSDNLFLTGSTYNSNSSMGSFSEGFVTKLSFAIPSNIPDLNVFDNKIHVYPNPSYSGNNNFHIYFDLNFSSISISLYSSLGEQIYKQTNQDIIKGDVIDLSLVESLQGGIYFVRVFDSKKNILLTSKKIIVY